MIQELAAKRIILLAGSTGSGKSTLANAFINGIGEISENALTGRLNAKTKIEKADNER